MIVGIAVAMPSQNQSSMKPDDNSPLARYTYLTASGVHGDGDGDVDDDDMAVRARTFYQGGQRAGTYL